MRLNHVTVTVSDIERAVTFYETLGLIQIVAAYPAYARFVCPDGDSTLSLHALGPGEHVGPQATTVHFECEELDEKVAELKTKGLTFDQDPIEQPYLWREAILRDPDGNIIFLFHAGANRLDPPWRLPRVE
jgi:catechol 2,3-dioxygenase-like lactoylglutathione lyase family enzyme